MSDIRIRAIAFCYWTHTHIWRRLCLLFLLLLLLLADVVHRSFNGIRDSLPPIQTKTSIRQFNVIGNQHFWGMPSNGHTLDLVISFSFAVSPNCLLTILASLIIRIHFFSKFDQLNSIKFAPSHLSNRIWAEIVLTSLLHTNRQRWRCGQPVARFVAPIRAHQRTAGITAKNGKQYELELEQQRELNEWMSEWRCGIFWESNGRPIQPNQKCVCASQSSKQQRILLFVVPYEIWAAFAANCWQTMHFFFQTTKCLPLLIFTLPQFAAFGIIYHRSARSFAPNFSFNTYSPSSVWWLLAGRFGFEFGWVFCLARAVSISSSPPLLIRWSRSAPPAPLPLPPFLVCIVSPSPPPPPVPLATVLPFFSVRPSGPVGGAGVIRSSVVFVVLVRIAVAVPPSFPVCSLLLMLFNHQQQ